MKYQSELKLATEAAIEAGKFLTELQSRNVDRFEGKDIKMEADRMSEKILVDRLKTTGIGILSEEMGTLGGQSGLRWILDPIDGTYNYFRNSDLCCVSVALWDKDQPILGVVYQFWRGLMIEGVVGSHAKVNGERVHASKVDKLSDVVFATGFPSRRSYESDSLRKFITSAQVFKKVRMLGSATLMSSFVGTGQFDIYSEEDIMLWDIAAGAAIIVGGGGCFDCKTQANNQCHFTGFANTQLRDAYHARS
ncbi:MAG: hypothetical protein A2Y14_02845 [Verrucomicrobia bacterium GWF2_51_19]|nr:MAG: hypothetical protein A2Y14_02845 [Verrucomicrobia bacterium GWF2_51_19]